MRDSREATLMLGCWLYPQKVVENPKEFGNEEKVRRLANRAKDLLYNFSREKMEALFDLTGLIDIFCYYEKSINGSDADDEDILKALVYLRETSNKPKRQRRTRKSKR